MERIFLGGYTRRRNNGIQIYEIDLDKNIFRKIESIDEGSPTFLAKSGNMLFAITTREEGGLASFVECEGEYREIDCIGNMLSSPCHLYFDEKRRLLYASNYHQGRLDIIKVDEAAHMSLVHTEKFVGSSIISPNQDSSRIHMCVGDVDDRYIIVVDLGADMVYSYEIDEEFNMNLRSKYIAKPGFGPRHIVFDSRGEYAYLIGELSSEIDILSYYKDKGEFSHIGYVSTLEDGYLGDNTAAAIKISSDGKYLYASNRGDDSIAVFEIGENGIIKMIQIAKTSGLTPRDFALVQDEKYILIGHQDGDVVSIMHRDEQSGRLKLLKNKDIEESEIVCIISEK